MTSGMSSGEDFRSFLSALVDDNSISLEDASGVEVLLSDPQRALLLRALPIWHRRPGGAPNSDWLVQQIWSDSALRPLCIDLVMTLMFGLPFEDGQAAATGGTDLRASRHFRGQFWRLVGGHPPGLSGGYYGHWSYPAER
jgi:hypothetical protein